MKISVVIPAFDEEQYLPALFQSLKTQDFPRKDFEVIVVDNNSTDKTSFIAEKFGAKVFPEKRQGITYARDTGARKARGEIIISSDADCVFPKNYLLQIYEQFRSDKNLRILCTSVRMPDAPIAGKVILRTLHLIGFFYAKIYKGSAPVLFGGANFAYRRDIFLKIGGYRFESVLLEKGINTGGTDDFDIVSRIKDEGKALYLPDLTINTSGRRFKGRFLYWFFVEYLLGFIINSYLSRFFSVVIPVPSYFKRRNPTFIENMGLSISFAFILFLFFSSLLVPLFSSENLRNEVGKKSISSYRKYEKGLVTNVINPVKKSQTIKDWVNYRLGEIDKMKKLLPSS